MVNFNSQFENSFPVINIKINEQNFNEESIINEAISNLKEANIKGFDSSDESWWKGYKDGKFYLYLAPDADNDETARENARVAIVIDINNVPKINDLPAGQNKAFIDRVNEIRKRIFEGFSNVSKASPDFSVFSDEDLDDFYGPRTQASSPIQTKPLPTSDQNRKFKPQPLEVDPLTPLSSYSEPILFTREESDAFFKDNGIRNVSEQVSAEDSKPDPIHLTGNKPPASLWTRFTRINKGKKVFVAIGTILTAPLWVPVAVGYLIIKKIFG